MTDGPREWLTENTWNLNIFNLEIFLSHKVRSKTIILDDVRKTNIYLVTEFVSEFVGEFVSESMTEGQTR